MHINTCMVSVFYSDNCNLKLAEKALTADFFITDICMGIIIMDKRQL